MSKQLGQWANKHQITLLYIQQGKPTQHAYIARFNWTARHEWLDLPLFSSVEHAQILNETKGRIQRLDAFRQ